MNVHPEQTAGGVLYVCRENIGRSQVAEAFSARQRPDVAVASAGIIVDNESQPIHERPEATTLLRVMQHRYGMDISGQTRTSLDDIRETLGGFAVVVIMAEESVVPEWLNELPNAADWEVPDLKGLDEDQTIEVVEHIQQGVSKYLPFQ